MIIGPASQFHVYLQFLDTCLAKCLNSVLNVKALLCFQPEEGLGAISVIVKTYGSFAALVTSYTGPICGVNEALAHSLYNLFLSSII